GRSETWGPFSEDERLSRGQATLPLARRAKNPRDGALIRAVGPQAAWKKRESHRSRFAIFASLSADARRTTTIPPGGSDRSYLRPAGPAPSGGRGKKVFRAERAAPEAKPTFGQSTELASVAFGPWEKGQTMLAVEIVKGPASST